MFNVFKKSNLQLEIDNLKTELKGIKAALEVSETDLEIANEKLKKYDDNEQFFKKMEEDREKCSIAIDCEKMNVVAIERVHINDPECLEHSVVTFQINHETFERDKENEGYFGEWRLDISRNQHNELVRKFVENKEPIIEA